MQSVLGRSTFMKQLAFAVGVLALLLGGAGRGAAGFVNSGFETGNFSGWQTAGDTSVQVTIFGIAPDAGLKQALVTNLPDGGGTFSYSGTLSVSVSGTLNAFLGATLPGNSQGTAFEGSAIKQTVTLNAGDVLSFRYNYLTDENTNSGYDYGFVTINGAVTILAD